MSAVAWGDVPTWGLLGLAAATAMYARRAYRQQIRANNLLEQEQKDQHALTIQQVNVLELQARDLRASLLERQHRAAQEAESQATRVLAWQKHWPRDPRVPQAVADPGAATPVLEVRVKNGSDQPVSSVEIACHLGHAPEPEPQLVGQLQPDAEEVRYFAVPRGAPPEQFNAVVRFRDSDQVQWIRFADSGRLMRTDG